MSHYDWAFMGISQGIAFLLGTLFGLSHGWDKLMRAWEEIAILKAEKMQAERKAMESKMEDRIEQF